MKKTTRGALAVAVPLALALALAGCADSDDTSMPGMDHGVGASAMPSTDVPGGFADADVMFAAMMIPHHQQAVEMSDLVLAKEGVDDDVRALAQQIKDAQAPEIELMRSWLDGWGADAGEMSHGDGMMSDADMAALEDADGAEASRLFLEQMIVHHEGAIEMAEAELSAGVDPAALELAQTIIDAQTAEIAEMRDLLTRL